MDILVYKWDIYPYDDIISTLKKQGHSVDVLAFPILNHLHDEAFETALTNCLKKDYDFVFSVNFFAVIAKLCFKHNIPYAAWTCDSPLLSLTSSSVMLPTSYIFLFDKKDYDTLLKKNAPHVYYLPLAGMSQNTDGILTSSFYYDISFVGNLYDKNRYDEMCYYLPDYLCGYMDSIIEAQKNVSGGYLIPQMLNDSILTDLMHYTKFSDTLSDDGTAKVPEDTSLELLRLHFATTVLSYKVAADNRALALNTLARDFKVDLFTTSLGNQLNNVHIHPPVDYHTQMPEIFSHSKINLNLTAPNIANGIPLRVFDILAAGGFLLSDYRRELCELFENGREIVVFEGIQDLMQKTEYYLAHSDLRAKIARNGQKKVQHLHRYDIRMEKILHTLFH